MSPAFALTCLALVCGLWPSAHGLSFPTIIDDISRQFAQADRVLKQYVQVHTERNKGALKVELEELKLVQSDLINSPVSSGLFARLKQAFRPVIDEMVDEIEGVLGITNSARNLKKLKYIHTGAN